MEVVEEVGIIREKVRDLDSVSMYELLLTTDKSTPYRYDLSLYTGIVDTYTKKVGRRNYNAVQWFFTNVVRALRKQKMAFSTKLDKNYWVGNDCNIGYRQVKNVLDFFEKEKYITIYLGSKSYVNEWECYPSIVKMEQKLINMFDMKEIVVNVAKDVLQDVVVVKDRITKEALPLPDGVGSLIDAVNKYNTWLEDVCVKFNNKEVGSIEYKRSFNDNLEQGGRLYVHGGGIQLVPAAYRTQHITINDENVVELDYRAMHPNICFQFKLNDTQDVKKFVGIDPYNIDFSFLDVNEDDVEDWKEDFNSTKYNPARTLAKKALLMMINASDETQARKAINQELYLDKQRERKDKLFVGIYKPRIDVLMEKLEEHNYIIADEFYRDRGVQLQYTDSEIAMRIVDLMMQEGETVLSWHDSFACRKSVEHLLHECMRRAWLERFGDLSFCRIDVK